MPKSKWLYAGIPVIIFFIILLLISAASIFNVSAQESNPDPVNGGNIENVTEEDPVKVSVHSIGKNEPFYLSQLGAIEAKSEVTVYPSTSGQVDAINVEEGEQVNKGDVLFVIGGANGIKHPAITQYDIAHANYESAKEANKITAGSMETAVKTAELQLESAKHQSEGSYIDYQAIAKSLETAKDGIGLIRNTLSETRLKNERDLKNMEEDIDDMVRVLDDFDDEKRDILIDLMNQMEDAADDATKEALLNQLDATRAELDSKRDELEKGLEQLEQGYDSLESGSILTENQIIGQLEQAQSQEHQLYMTKDSMQLKLGLFDGTSDPLKLAEQGVNAAKSQAQAAILQSSTALKLAELNLQIAADQKQSLLVKAPVSGTVSKINIKEGSSASPQIPLTQIINTDEYVLRVAVDGENARRINKDTRAEVLIGGRYVKVNVLSVAPLADPVSKLVDITLKLPNISMKANQTLQARFSLLPDSSDGGSRLFVPLDAVTIGTENQFLFILDGDKAKEVNVKLGEINNDMIEIIEGLDGDEQIIVEGAKDVLDGKPVKLN